MFVLRRAQLCLLGGGGAFRFPKTVFEMSLRETQISMFAPPRAPI